MPRVSRVVNPDGEIVPFRRSRVVRAILAAVRAAGSSDEWVADQLADMVVYFLDVQHGDRPAPPTAADVDDMIEKALLATPDLADIARAFLDMRSQREEIRELEADLAGQESAGAPQVAQADAGLGGWDRSRIAAAIMRENGLSMTIAGEAAQAVEERIRGLDLPRVTTGLIRELVDVELLQRGVLRDPGAISVPRYDLEQWLFPGIDTDLPPVSDQRELGERTAQRVLSEYTLNSVHGSAAREAHLDARLHFDRIDSPAAVVQVRLDVPSLLDEGAGFGLRRIYPDVRVSMPGAFARMAAVLGEVSAFATGVITLDRFDAAFAPLMEDRRGATLSEGLKLLAGQAPGGLLIRVGAARGAESAEVIRELLEVLGGEDSALRARVGLEFSVAAGAFADDDRRALLERAAVTASFCGLPRFRLNDRPGRVEGGMFGELPGALPHRALLARAGINLVRPAIESGEISVCLATLEETIQLAVDGLAQRVRFLERAALRDLPEPIAASSRMLRALVGSSRETALVPVGLARAAVELSGCESPLYEEAQRVAQQIVSYLDFKFRECAERAGITGRLSAEMQDAAGGRMMRADLGRVTRRDPESPLRLKLATGGAYAYGCEFAGGMIDARLAPEAALHRLIPDARLRTDAGQTPTAAEVLKLLRGCLAEGAPRPNCIEVSVSTRICRDCGNTSPGETEACPTCGSTAWAVPAGQRFLFG